MTAQDMIEEVKASHYRANTITKNLVHPLATSGFPLFQDALLPAYLGLHDAANCARVAPFMGDPGFKIGHGKVFQEWERLPENANTVNNLRKFLEARSLFISSYQTDKSVIGEHVRLGDNPTEPLLVDIGGGDPISLLLFLDRYVNEIGKGRIVVQHRPEAIEKTKLELLQHIQHIQHIEAMPHHYFNPQPEATQGAAIYYMRQVLGTQNTTTCLQILAALVSAMREHSILIIDEKVFPDGREEPDENFVPMTELSMDMLAIFNIVTRREGIWRTMLDKAGYEIKNIHKYSPMHDYIIVAKKKQADSLPD
ncbi:S-adenosyl-L-methionine-dependent methyltransferase [Acephala macrosclerotiorum]|nr:S-adenosyl-L-methionine-dependent methyltransferase [Acephala macrosclerotiorum]